MNIIRKFMAVTLSALALSATQMPVSQAHMMVAQHGTLNVVGEGAFMVLSLPVSAFFGTDDNNDSLLSVHELNAHRADIIKQVATHVTLSGAQGNLPLQGILLSPVVSHETPNAPASHVIVMGRFALQDTDDLMHLTLDLFGTRSDEKIMKMSINDKSNNRSQSFDLTPQTISKALFTSTSE